MNPIMNMMSFDKSEPKEKVCWEVTIGEYRYHLSNTGIALVFKGNSIKPSYRIDKNGCDCPSAAYGQRPCKHEKPLSFRSDGHDTSSHKGDETSSWSDVTDLLS